MLSPSIQRPSACDAVSFLSKPGGSGIFFNGIFNNHYKIG
jgi:hypothetical protein